MFPFFPQPTLAGHFPWMNTYGVAALVVCACTLAFSSCATRRSPDMPAGTNPALSEAVVEPPRSNSTRQGIDGVSGAGFSRSPRIDSSTPVEASSPDRKGARPSSVTKPQGLEEWVAGRLGSGVAVRLSSSGTLIVSRTKPTSEPLPLFEEAILLGELRALVRSYDVQRNAEIALRDGVASLTLQSPLQTNDAVGIISKILEFREVSEVRVMSRPRKG